MSNKAEQVVYWAPAYVVQDDWRSAHGGLVYPDPKNLHSVLMKEKNKDRGPISFLSCPAATTTFANTAVFFNSMDCSYKYDLSGNVEPFITPNEASYLNCAVKRNPTLVNKPTIEFQLYYVFFSETPLTMRITPPMFHQPKYTKYATAVPGQFDIGRWFRPFVFEVQMWEPKGELVFESQEPLFYASFDTTNTVKLQKFSYTPELSKQAGSCVNFYKNEMSLDKRYELFDQSSLREQILRDIKNNLIS